jgi:hypothetical protein
MGNELLFAAAKNPLQTKKEPAIPDIETEIEYPHCCYDIMALSSDFDRLCYFCESILIKPTHYIIILP